MLKNVITYMMQYNICYLKNRKLTNEKINHKDLDMKSQMSVTWYDPIGVYVLILYVV